MSLRKTHRIVAVLVALASIAFAQLAIAAHACGAASDDAPGVLCHAHCQQESQSLDKPPVPVVPAISPSGLVLPAPSLPDAVSRSADLPGLFARTTAPPDAIRYCRFRI